MKEIRKLTQLIQLIETINISVNTYLRVTECSSHSIYKKREKLLRLCHKLFRTFGEKERLALNTHSLTL